MSEKAVWAMAEQCDGTLKEVSFELLTRGRKLADKLGVPLVSILIGDGVSYTELERLICQGADKVFAVQHPALAAFICEPYTAVLEKLITDYQPIILLAAATSSGRTLMPYIAVKVQTGLTADCTELDIEDDTGNLLQTRPAIGGNIMATIKTPNHRPQIATVRPKSTRPLPFDKNRKGEVLNIPFEPLIAGKGVELLGYRKDETSALPLEDADVIVAGGRGLKKGDNFSMIHKLAETLNAAAGATRDAVDRGWISYPHQIGLSGKTVSPKVYIAAGISGAIQHLAGIKTSESIISINIDPEANLHKLADLAIVGDAFQVLPELQRRIELRLGGKNAV
jgi:electron transfer flavoprotein alpha subunit